MEDQSQQQHHVVCLEECHCPMPKFPFPHRFTGYNTTTREEVAAKLQDATIAITTMIPITLQDLDLCPHLKCVFTMSTGIEWVDREGFQKRGVRVINAPQTNVTAVSEHAFALYFAARRKTIELHNKIVTTSEYSDKSTLTHCFPNPPLTWCMETMVVYGHGHLGQRIASIAATLGMKVLLAERKGASPRQGRTAFNECLKHGTLHIITVPKNAETMDMMAEPEFKSMRNDAIIVNVARGGIVQEAGLVSALRKGWIAGAATDVYEREPPQRETSVLLDETIPNLILSPHIAWFSAETIRNLQDAVFRGLSDYVAGKRTNVVV